MSETSTNGAWKVKPGEEDAFVAEWTNFVNWAVWELVTRID